MKIDSFPRLNPDDFGDAPEFFRQFLDALNPILEQVIEALQGNLAFGENFNGIYRTVLVEDGVDMEIRHGLKGSARDVQCVATGRYSPWRIAWENRDKETIKFRVTWDSPPAERTQVLLRILGD